MIVSDASGVAAANTVESLFQAVAARQGARLLMRDVRPLPPGDTSGSALYFVLIVCTIAGFTAVAAWPGLRICHRSSQIRGVAWGCREYIQPA